MCTPWDTSCIAGEIASAAADSVFGQLSDVIVTAEQWLIDTSASWWVMVPSISLYPNAGNMDPNAAPIDAVARLHALILPITAIIAVGGMIWNGLLMVLSRKPAPLVNVLRGLWNTALWSAVGIFGTNLMLQASDAFSTYVITSALKSVGDPSMAKRMSALLIPVTGKPGGLPVGLVLTVAGIAMICSFVQALLMLFRDGSVLVLSAVTTLAAAGDFTDATRGWKPRVVGWSLGLIFYKPVAAMVYATMIWLTGENTSKDPRVLLMGLSMLIVSLVALPAVMKFFNWTIGSMQGGGGGLGMLATAGAAGMHAAASLRGGGGGGGGGGVNEHARYMSESFDRRGGGGGAPTGAGMPGPSGGGGGGVGGGGGGAPRFTGPTGGGGGGVPMPMPAASSSAGGREGREPAQAATGVVNAGTWAAEAAAPAAGPAAPIVQGAAVAVRAATQAASAAGNAMADAADNSTKGG